MTPSDSSRRTFLKSAVAGAAASALAAAPIPAFARHAWAGGRDGTLKVGLVGCGGRGTGAAADALAADEDVKLVAMGDAFRDRIDSSLANLMNDKVGPKVAVDDDHKFTGFDAFRKVIDSGVDVVLLCSPPHFRPAQIEHAVEKGVHVFAEKPVAVDAPGVRRVHAACERAAAKSLSVVSGLCWRYDDGMRPTFQRIHDGELGDIVSMQCTYNTGGLWSHARKPEWSDLEWQLRNWLYFTWLSGDHIVEQHIHSLDKLMWARKDEPPVKAVGHGGRQVRTDAAFGHIYDHFAIVYEWADGVRGYGFCRQQDGCANEVNDQIVGTKGRCDVMKNRITGAKPWVYEGKKRSMYRNEHDELFAAIRSGKPINNGRYMCQSTLLAILGRMAGYTGQTVTWEQAWNSKEDLSPPSYDWGPLPTPPVPMPGLTRVL